MFTYIGLIMESYTSGIGYYYSDLNNIIKRWLPIHERNIIHCDYNVS